MKYLLIIAIFCGIYAASQLPLPTNFQGKTYVNNTEVREKIKDIKKIQAFIRKYNPKAEAYAESFVDSAKKNNVDYKQLIAISIKESTAFKQDGYCKNNGGGVNGFGLMEKTYKDESTGKTVYIQKCFKDYQESIEAVAQKIVRDRRRTGNDLHNSLCYWRYGNTQGPCDYSLQAVSLMKGI